MKQHRAKWTLSINGKHVHTCSNHLAQAIILYRAQKYEAPSVWENDGHYNCFKGDENHG